MVEHPSPSKIFGPAARYVWRDGVNPWTRNIFMGSNIQPVFSCNVSICSYLCRNKGHLGVKRSSSCSNCSYFLIIGLRSPCDSHQNVEGWLESERGIGNILILVPTNTCPKDYFPKLVMIATGILLSGGSMGVTVMPWFFRELLVEYGWRGSLLILGGLNAHLVVVASLLEPIKRMDSSQDSDKKSPSSSRAGENENEFSSSDDLSRSHKALHRVTYNAASEPSNGQLSFNDDGGQNDGRSVKTRSIISKGFITTTRFIGLTIFKDHPLMALLCLQAFIFGLSYIGWLLYIVPNALAKGHSSQKAVQISIVGGAFNFIGRLGIGFFWSRKYIKFKLWHSLICLLSAALFWINFVVQRFEILMVLSAFYGVLMGALVTSQFQLVMNVVGKDSPEDYKTGMSIFFIGRGLSSPVAGAIFGRLYDITKSYDISFGFISGLNVLNAFLCIAPLC
ncbi:monocarboxylate transporter 12-like [Lytechinus variegatus]|uniref:monocarboxylate transporter 12-like n=1 Tax=Lytechinus variegatus TaxID=7654 RepID=UPI001BB2B42D|nr:monocarboxylate transporter 12-like [Lytechinus variegatus]